MEKLEEQVKILSKKDEEIQKELTKHHGEPESKRAKLSCENEESAESIISNLGHVAEDITSRFSCGGKFELPNSSVVKVAYKTTTTTHTTFYINWGQYRVTEIDEVWSSIEFPGTSKAAMTKLLDVCSVASFGYKDKDVIDKNY